MRKIISWIVILAVGMLMGCQKTLERPAVLQKDLEQMLETAVGSQTQPEQREIDSLYTQLGAPERIQTEVFGSSDAMKVRVDARVGIPDVQGMPIYQVSSSEFTQEFADRLYQRLCAGTPMYIEGNGLTRPELEEEILKAKQFLASDTITDEERANTQDALAVMEAIYPDAPETRGDPLTHILLQTNDGDLGDGMRVQSFCAAEHPNKMGKRFYVRGNVTTEGGEVNMRNGTLCAPRNDASLRFNDGTPFGIAGLDQLETVRSVRNSDASEMPFPPSEAAERANALLSEFGMVGFSVSDIVLQTCHIGARRYAYGVKLCREVDGVPVYSPPFYSVSSVIEADEGAVGAEWRYETAELGLTESGEVFLLEWVAPLTLGERIVESANLLPFDEVMAVFEKMMCVANEPTPYETNGLVGKVYTIDRITLTLQRVAERDSLDGGLLIPVWNFFGTVEITQTDGMVYSLNGKNGGADSFLSINAIDGTVIDPKKGY